jgi:hypothetical protein
MFNFSLNKNEINKYKKWHEEQRKKHNIVTAIGGEETFCFTPTGLDTVVEIKNNVTGEILDLTNYDKW